MSQNGARSKGILVLQQFLNHIGKTKAQLLEELTAELVPGEIPKPMSTTGSIEVTKTTTTTKMSKKQTPEKANLSKSALEKQIRSVESAKIEELDILSQRLAFRDTIVEAMENLKKHLTSLKDISIDQLLETIDNLVTYIDRVQVKMTDLALKLEGA